MLVIHRQRRLTNFTKIADNENKSETPALNKQGKGHITRLINKDKQKIVEINNEINIKT